MISLIILKIEETFSKIKLNLMLKKNIFDNTYTYWKNIDKKILSCFLLLFVLGVFFSFSSTSSLAGERLNKDNYFFFLKHLSFASISLIIMLFISLISKNFLEKISVPFFLISFSLLFLVPFFGVEVKGSKRWLDLEFVRLQPVEIIKPFFVMIIAKALSYEKFKKKFSSFLISFLILISTVILLINQPDFGQTILLAITWGSIIFISGVNVILIFFIGMGILLSAALVIYLLPDKFGYILNRFSTFLNPSSGDNFQSSKALEAIRQGGFKGQGMGEGILKDSVPEAHTDYIIAVITEEFGAISSIMIVIIFLYISFRVIKICIDENDDNLKLSLTGLASLLVFQTFIHVGVNTSILPTTGMTLPFLSYGGSSLLGSAILAGVILNFTKKRYLNES